MRALWGNMTRFTAVVANNVITMGGVGVSGGALSESGFAIAFSSPSIVSVLSSFQKCCCR